MDTTLTNNHQQLLQQHQQHSDHSENSHHHHSHHHHHSSSSNGGRRGSASLISELKEYYKAEKSQRKYKDATSIFRAHMRKRSMRKKLLESMLLWVTYMATFAVLLAVVYAYYFDKP